MGILTVKAPTRLGILALKAHVRVGIVTVIVMAGWGF